MNETKPYKGKLRKGDKVMAVSGNFRGQTGTVLSVDGEQIVVQGLNLRKKHVKPQQQGQKGSILEFEKPIHVSNLKLCIDDKPVKLRKRINDAGEKELYYKDGDKETTYRTL